MAQFETWYKQDLKKPLVVHRHADVFNQDSRGNLIGVEVYSDGEPVSLSGSIDGYCLLSDGTTVSAVGANRAGNKASILIPQTAYNVPGPITITIKNTDGNDITTLCAVVGLVRQSVSGNLVQPGDIVTDWSQSINAQLQAVQDAADNVGAIVAAPFAENTAYVVGNYVTYNGNLYRITADHAAGVTWANTAKTQCTVGTELYDLKSALNNTNNDLFHFEDTGKLLVTRGEFGRDVYNPNTGAIGTTRPYRISARKVISFPYETTIKAQSGYKFLYYSQNSQTGNWAASDWMTEKTFSANASFYMQITKDPEATTEIADIVEYINALSVTGGVIEGLLDDVVELQGDVTQLESDVSDIHDSIGVISDDISVLQTDVIRPVLLNVESGKYTYSTKEADSKRLRTKQLMPVKSGDKVIVYSPTLHFYIAILETPTSSSYLQTSNWKKTDETHMEYVFVCNYDGYVIVNIRKRVNGSDVDVSVSDYDGYMYICNNYNIAGKAVHVYQFGGNGNDWCFVRTPTGYDPKRSKPYPFVICNHGNGWVMDGSIEKANWTKRTMYIPSSDPDAESDQYNVTDDSSLWYSNPTIEALLTAGYIVCGCENYGDGLYGNNNCRKACVNFFYHMVNAYNVENRCYMIGASNGAMTSLNAAYLLQGKVKAMILQYPLTCLVNQYEHPGSSASGHPAAIRSAYGIEDSSITEEELTKAVATHDPLTVDVVDGRKVGTFPPTAIYYSEGDQVVSYDQNAIPLYNMLYASNKVVSKVQCTGNHGDKSMFVPSDFVAWFDAN